MSEPFEVITFGSATVDIFLSSPLFVPLKREGEEVLCHRYNTKIEVKREALVSGGGGSNIAVGLQRLGLKTALVARTGDDLFSQLIKKELEKEGVGLDFFLSYPGEETDFSLILVSPQGGRTILVSRGETKLEEDDIDWKRLKAEWFFLSSLEGNLSLASQLLDWAEEKKIKVGWNPGKRELKEKEWVQRLTSQAYFLVLNQEEAEGLVEKPMESNQFWEEFFSFPSSLVVVTQGKKGAWLIEPKKKKRSHYPAVKGVVRETTGAGDAFCAGFLAALFYRLSPPEAVCWGLINSSRVISFVGAKKGLLKREEMEKRVQKLKRKEGE